MTGEQSYRYYNEFLLPDRYADCVPMDRALEQQITLLTLKKQHLENLISLAKKIRSTGGNVMDFTAFDTQRIKKYTEQAKKEWGDTPEYKEFEEKTAHKIEKEVKDMSSQLMEIVAAFGFLM